MKKFFCILICLLSVCFSGWAVSFASDVKEFSLDNGIRVYYRKAENTDVCGISLVVSGGIIYLPEEKSGLENALFTMMTRGSKFYSNNELKNFKYNTQGSISSSSGTYGSVYSMNCLSKYFDETFERFSDGFLNPGFEEKEYNLLMQEESQSVQYVMNDPESLLFYYAKKMIYDGHPYSTSASVTPDSIENITVKEMKELLDKIQDSRRIKIVACGDFDSDMLYKKLNKAFGRIKTGTYELKSFEVPEIKIEGKPVILSHPDAKKAGYVMRIFPSPSVRNQDYYVCPLINSIYNDVLYNIVREDKGVCYAPSTFNTSSEAAFGGEFLYKVSNLKDFKAAVLQAQKYMKENKIVSTRNSKNEYVFDRIEDRLNGYKNKYINGKYATQATVAGVIGRMCAGLLQFDDVFASDKVTEKVKAVTAEDILRVFNKYWCEQPGMWFAVVAPEEESEICF